MTLGYYSRNLSGHRKDYLNFVTARFGGRRVNASEALWWKDAVLFLMIEENFALYCVTALWRSLLGRRTVGLLFRPIPAVEGTSWRLRSKRFLLRGLRVLPQVKTLSIVPAALYPKILNIADDWIHDFQLWDISEEDRRKFSDQHFNNEKYADAQAILKTAKQYANGRPIVVALGAQNRAKGTVILANSMDTILNAGWAVVVAGRFSDNEDVTRERIIDKGGLVIDRFLSNDEILALYATANAVWCLYDPAYNQASGILGRAVQLGVSPIVRNGSLSAALCEYEGIHHGASAGGDELTLILSNLLENIVQNKNSIELTTRIKEQNTDKLRRALNLANEKMA